MYDICIIGAGPGGYVAAVKAAKLGAKVLLVEKEILGGTCLNKGCIPTKALAHSAQILTDIKQAKNIGINTGPISIEFKKLIQHKDDIVSKVRSGIDYLVKTNKIEYLNAKAEIISKNKIKIGENIIDAKNIIIATGSSPIELGAAKFNGTTILSSEDLLNLEEIPVSLLIIGSGVIGCEFASIFSEFGSKIIMVEALERILPVVDQDVSKKLEVSLKKKGIEIFTKTKIEKVEIENNKVKTYTNTGKTIETEKVLVSVGRKANLQDMNLEKLGVKVENNKIIVDSHMKTSAENIYAIGDVVGRFWLAHVASYEAAVAAENIMGVSSECDYLAVPSCIFTRPEIAAVGLGEDEAKRKNINVKIGKYHFQASGRAHTAMQTEGFVKIIAEIGTDKILGAQIIGPHATDIISEITLALKTKATLKDLEQTIHPHPTFSESIQEAASSIFEGAIHIS